MRIIIIFSVISTLAGMFFFSCKNDKGLLPPAPLTPTVCDSVKYAKDIQPLFDTYCVSCHSQGSPYGNLDLTSYSAASLKADTIKTRVWDQKDNSSLVMPPAGNATPTDLEREKIKCWVESGAPNN